MADLLEILYMRKNHDAHKGRITQPRMLGGPADTPLSQLQDSLLASDTHKHDMAGNTGWAWKARPGEHCI